MLLSGEVRFQLGDRVVEGGSPRTYGLLVGVFIKTTQDLQALRYCGPSVLHPEACASVRATGDNDSHALGQVYYGSTYPSGPRTTTDSDPHPEGGYYVATAAYEICIFNGGNIHGVGRSQYAYYDVRTGKVTYVKDTTKSIIP